MYSKSVVERKERRQVIANRPIDQQPEPREFQGRGEGKGLRPAALQILENGRSKEEGKGMTKG